MEEKNYTKNTTVQELLADDFFIESILLPTAETQAFWHHLIQNDGLSVEVFQEASAIVLANHIAPVEFDLVGRLDKIEDYHQAKTSYSFIKYAAAAVLLMSLSFFAYRYFTVEPFNHTSDFVSSRLADTSDILLLGDGGKSVISIEGNQATLDFSDSDSLKVNSKSWMALEDKNITMQQVVVPFGKRLSLILPDKSKLWVNAGTTVKFPSAFVGNKREIYVNGEVYGDITKDPSKPFFFKTKSFDVQVLGTSLNIYAYESDKNGRVTLVEGRVKVNNDGEDFFLAPNQSYALIQDQSKVESVSVQYYTSWKDGYYHFKNEKLISVLNNIERYYGTKVETEPAVNNMLCSGNLGLNDDAKSVLEGIAFTLGLELKYENKIYKLYQRPM